MKGKEFIRKAILQVLKEELDIPSKDGTSTGASEEDKQKAEKAIGSGEDVKFVKPGDNVDEEKKDNPYPADKTPSEESGMEKIQEEEVAPKVREVFSTLKELSDEVNALEEFAEKDGDNKMKKLSAKLGKHLADANKAIAEMKEARDAILAEDAEKASVHGDKVIKALGKYCKNPDHAKKIKEKYMPYIAKAHKKGKSPKDIAERIKDHRFEL